MKISIKKENYIKEFLLKKDLGINQYHLITFDLRFKILIFQFQ